jgi:hypothetical protein
LLGAAGDRRHLRADGTALCFGYADVARDKPNRYSFLPELAASKVEQISIEATQPNSISPPSTTRP